MKIGSQVTKSAGIVAVLSLIAGLAGITTSAQAVTQQVGSASRTSNSDFILDPGADPISSRQLSVKSAVDLVLNQNATDWGIVPSEWQITRLGQLRSGRDVVTLTQIFNGIPALGTSMVLSFSAEQALTSVQYQT